MRTIAILAAAAAALTSTIGMAQSTEQRFVHAGSTYVYTTTTESKRQVIAGHSYPSGDAFHLVVRGNRVSGDSGGTPVSFRIADVRPATEGIETAAR